MKRTILVRHERSTSAGVVVFHPEDGRCLVLLLLSRLTKRPLWEFPKGGVHEGETLLQAALRELHEETGLAEDEIRLVPDFRRTENYRFTVGEGAERAVVRKQVTYFAAHALHRRVRRSDLESIDHAWLPLHEARRRLRYPGRRRILAEAAEAAGCGALSP